MKLSPTMREALHRLGNVNRPPVRTFVSHGTGKEQTIATGATARSLRALQARGLAIAEAGNDTVAGPRGHYVNWRLSPEGHKVLSDGT